MTAGAMTFGQPEAQTAEPYLVVDNLTVQFPTHDGLVQAVSDLSYTVPVSYTHLTLPTNREV